MKALAGFVLPEGVLDYFEVVNVKETTVLIDPDAKDRRGLYGKELEIYLDELDNRTYFISHIYAGKQLGES